MRISGGRPVAAAVAHRHRDHMRIAKYSLIIACLTFCSTPAISAESLCKTFQTLAQSAPEQADERPWIEFHWGIDHEQHSFWSWGCRHSNDKVSKATCDWLMENTSHEFTMMLPLAVMSCYGYHLPKYASYDWSGIAGTIKLKQGDDYALVLDLDYRGLPDGEVAIRVSRYAPEPLPPIMPLAPIESEPTAAKNDPSTGH